jgi:hypothetical protein
MLRRIGGDRIHCRGVFAFALALAALLPGCEKWQLDAQVREMCAKDGGMKIYETVTLPPDQFDQWGMVKFYRPTGGEEALGREYIFTHEKTYLRQGNPQLVRERFTITRRSDNKFLGESVVYGRSGGDMPGPWHESTFHCPESREGEPNSLIKGVFLR